MNKKKKKYNHIVTQPSQIILNHNSYANLHDKINSLRITYIKNISQNKLST